LTKTELQGRLNDRGDAEDLLLSIAHFLQHLKVINMVSDEIERK
jgi:hypothetical protein